MSHELVYDHETDADAVFKCVVCGAVIGFNKQGVGEPSAVQDLAGTWQPPTNPDQWMGPCT